MRQLYKLSNTGLKSTCWVIRTIITHDQTSHLVTARALDSVIYSDSARVVSTYYVPAGSKNKSAKIGPLSDDNGNVTSTEQDMAHEFNQFFTTVFTKEKLSTVPMIQQMYCQYGQLLDIHVDDDVVMKKLSKLRQDKAGSW